MLLDEITTRSDRYAEVLKLVRRMAATDINVLILGETGTGKDFVAELIHDSSPRRANPFLKIDCASIPPSLAESEFFGYEKGAFSDAYQNKKGKLEMAKHGSVYLDGVNHLPPTVQSKLLRFVEERKVEPLGATHPVSVDCRLIASCSFPIQRCLQEKQLREDLYFRLAAVSIELPPLRERIQDIDLLATGLLKEFNKKYRKDLDFSPEAKELLRNYGWPGNIRELRNVIEQAVIHSERAIYPLNLYLKRSSSDSDSLSHAADRMLSLEEIEKAYITEVLRKVKGHQSRAAKILKINRKTLLMKKRKYRL